jgi:hypothetical protein
MTRSQRSGVRFDHLSQRTRRVVAVAALSGLPAMYAWSSFWMGTTVPNIAWGPVTFLLIGATIVGSFVLYGSARGRADMPGRSLDERERQLRDRAWILSYQVLSAVVVVAVAAAAIAVLILGREVDLDWALVSAAALCVGVLLPLLPTAALAWIEPDLPMDD